MRFDEFVLRVPDEEFRLRFHEHLTVLAGVGALERQALISAMVAALSGGGDSTTLTCVDHTGRSVELQADGAAVTGRYVDDGSSAPTPVGWLAPDAESLRSLIVLNAGDLGPSSSDKDRDDDPPELTEARATLRGIGAELEAATEAQRRLQAAEQQLDDIDARIREAEGDAARLAYTKAVAELERVKAEDAALRAGTNGAEADRHLLASIDEAHRLVTRWTELVAEAERARVGAPAVADQGIEPADVAHLAEVPDKAPADLPSLVSALVRAGEHVAALEDRLRQVASEGIPEPSDPRVIALATVDQAELWSAHERAVAADVALGHEHVAVGGLGADGDRAAAIEELEASHAECERAVGVIERRRVSVIGGAGLAAACGVPFGAVSPAFGLFLCAGAAIGTAIGIGGPWRARSAATRREAAALERVGVPTYLAFHLRRVDATLDPTALDRLGDAEAARAAAGRAWEAVSCGVDVATATALRTDVEGYARALAEQHGAVQEVTELRRTLDELAVPDLHTARERVCLAVEPYGLAAVDLEGLEPELVLGLVDRQVTMGRLARRQRSLDDAEADEEKVAGRLDDLLVSLGFTDGELADRVEALDAAAHQARDRATARTNVRTAPEVEADLHRLNAEVRRLHRPEWTDGTAQAPTGPDVDELVQARRAVVAELTEARELARAASTVDADHLTERHAAAERRVIALEAQLRGEGCQGADVDELHRYLLAAITKANHVGPMSEPVPVLLDDPFVRVPAERKWELMDMLRRLSEKTQVLYLTDDPFVGAWARRRADSGEISLLEPVD